MRQPSNLISALVILLALVVSSALVNFVASYSGASASKNVAPIAASHPANEASFNSFYHSGTAEIANAQYADALSSFKQAEGTSQLTDDQYSSLKISRQQIATQSVAAGHFEEAQAAYKSLVDSGWQQAEFFWKANRYDVALARYEDSEQASYHVIENGEASLLRSNQAVVACLRKLRRYQDAVDQNRRIIDYVRTSGDGYDSAIAAQYLQIAETYSLDSDWPAMEQPLRDALEEAEKRIARYSDLYVGDQPLFTALTDKDMALYDLIVVYQHEGRLDDALSTADTLFDFAAQYSRSGMELGPHSRRETAQLALRIATQENHQDGIDRWRQRMNQ